MTTKEPKEDIMSTKDRRHETKSGESTVNRRNILLGGTTLAAASALGSGVQIRSAQAQARPPAASGRPPNILVIWGDDIGTWNISHNSRA